MTSTSFQFRKLWRLTKPPKGKLGVSLVLSLLNTGVSLAIPIFIKQLMDSFQNGFSPSMIGLIVGLFFVQIASSAVSLFLLAQIGQAVVERLRTKLWNKFIHLPISFYDQNRSGEMVSRITNDTTIVMNLLSTEMIEFITNSLSVIVAIIILITIDVPMTLILLAAIPVTFLVIMPMARKMYKISKEQQDHMSKLTAFLAQMLGEIRLIKAYTTEKSEFDNGRESFHSLYQFGIRRAKIEALISPIMSAVMTGVLIAIVGFGAYRVSAAYISAGELVAFVLYLFQIMIPISSLTRFVTSFQQTKGASERIFQILDEAEEPYEDGLAVKEAGVLTFNNIAFGYGEDLILKNVSFSAQPGTMTAFVGPSGVGKSTIFSLMERFYEPSSGEIRLNGQRSDAYQLKDWRALFSYVQQDSPILVGTIRENMMYGLQREVTDQEIMEASTQANAHEFISGFPQGYDTLVGERGINLSGGQRQRIAIARAILRNPEFLLLDEATASLDSESEKLVQQALESMMKEKTSFVIAHRLSTVVNADQIIVMQNGTITGVGTHEELMNTHDFYRGLVRQQFQTGEES
ncbi:ABC transporter ATP-binding protein [Priestia koreensis]|uniref:ABC transporter ATP-binding protein n=1 Tax=Priestia koreensis TaxID=284581 RepID=UPI00203D17CE|nr:ABC transporter ATP-binding protein [Priestia koreensis]MCM3006249.1 ABC transporter ATP-binding protein/permease [Priestia koreensis]